MQNLKKNWHVLWKMAWGICQIFTRALKSLKIGTLIRFFCPKYKIYELKNYRGVMCHDNEEWCKIRKGIGLSFQKNYFKIDMKNLTNFDQNTQKSKNLLFNGLLWPKYIMFEPKKNRRVMFHGIEDWYKIWRKTDLCFQKWHKEFGKFSQTEK